MWLTCIMTPTSQEVGDHLASVSVHVLQRTSLCEDFYFQHDPDLQKEHKSFGYCVLLSAVILKMRF